MPWKHPASSVAAVVAGDASLGPPGYWIVCSKLCHHYCRLHYSKMQMVLGKVVGGHGFQSHYYQWA